MAHQLFRDVRIWIRVLAQRGHSSPAGGTGTARDGKWDDDAIAHLDALHFIPDLDDFSHELVTENVARLETGHEGVEQMEIRPADRGRRDSHDAVAGAEDLWIRDRDDVHFLRAHP